jgi:hypothetical protein
VHPPPHLTVVSRIASGPASLSSRVHFNKQIPPTPSPDKCQPTPLMRRLSSVSSSSDSEVEVVEVVSRHRRTAEEFPKQIRRDGADQTATDLRRFPGGGHIWPGSPSPKGRFQNTASKTGVKRNGKRPPICTLILTVINKLSVACLSSIFDSQAGQQHPDEITDRAEQRYAHKSTEDSPFGPEVETSRIERKRQKTSNNQQGCTGMSSLRLFVSAEDEQHVRQTKKHMQTKNVPRVGQQMMRLLDRPLLQSHAENWQGWMQTMSLGRKQPEAMRTGRKRNGKKTNGGPERNK